MKIWLVINGFKETASRLLKDRQAIKQQVQLCYTTQRVQGENASQNLLLDATRQLLITGIRQCNGWPVEILSRHSTSWINRRSSTVNEWVHSRLVEISELFHRSCVTVNQSIIVVALGVHFTMSMTTRTKKNNHSNYMTGNKVAAEWEERKGMTEND